MQETQYHVQLRGRTVGPYDRRTIVGMRIKKTLSSDDVLIGPGGSRLTVRDVLGKGRDDGFNPSRSGSYSIVQATYTAALVEAVGRDGPVPRFRGEIQIRVQGDVLRMAGRFRKAFRWKEDRVKLARKDVVHVRVRGSLVDLWLRAGDRLHRITLELFMPDSATEFVQWLPHATPAPVEAGLPAIRHVPTALLLAGGALALALCLALVAVLVRR